MDIMKRNLLLAVVLSAFVTIPAMASMTVEQGTDAEYLINSGYSKSTAEEVFIEKNRVTGKPIEPLYQGKYDGIKKGYKWFWGYFDPAIDRADRIHHDVQDSPSFADL